MAEDDVIKIAGIGKVTKAALATHGITTVGQLSELEPGEINVNNLSALISRAKRHILAKEEEEEEQDGPEMVFLTPPSAGMTAFTGNDKKTESGSGTTDPPSLFDKILGSGKDKGQQNKHEKALSKKLKKVSDSDKGQQGKKNNERVLVIESELTQQRRLKQEALATTTEENEHNPEDAESSEKFLIKDHSWWEMKVLLPRKVNKTDYELKEAIVFELSLEPHSRVSFICSWVVTDEENQREKLCAMTYSPQIVFYFNLSLPPFTVSMREEDYKSLPHTHVLENVMWEVDLMHHFQNRSIDLQPYSTPIPPSLNGFVPHRPSSDPW